MPKNFETKVEYNKARPNENGRDLPEKRKSLKKDQVIKDTKKKLLRNFLGR